MKCLPEDFHGKMCHAILKYDFCSQKVREREREEGEKERLREDRER